MKLPKIVIPYNKSLLRSISGQIVAVRVKNIAQAAEAADQVRDSANALFCVIVDTNSPLAELGMLDGMKEIPLAIMAPAMGKFRRVAEILPILRGGNIRVYLPCDQPDNITSLRLLSSLGIHCCALFAPGETDWEALADLMTYAVLERAPHAPMEPFEFIASSYVPGSYLDWGRVFFDDPRHFLHLDARGRVALSHREASTGNFIAAGIAEIASADELPAISERINSWRYRFAENHPCAYCAGWKICLGRFAAEAGSDGECAAFFQEMLDVSRQRAAQRAGGEELRIWQP